MKWVNFFGRKGKILRNVYIPKENEETSEIDLLYITQKGIFVFESKNYSGWIFGDENSQYWTAMLANRQKNRFYNPIKQNQTHMKWLHQCVGDSIPLFSIIVFSERCELKKITVENPDVKVIKRDRTYAAVRNIWESVPDALTDEKTIKLYEMLKRFTNVEQSIKESHIETIERKYKENRTRPKAAPEKEVVPEVKLCPRCGKELVLRTAKKGPNAGNQFYGCSGFPSCRYIENLYL